MEVIKTKVGLSRGKARIWLEGNKLQRECFGAGVKYDVTASDNSMVLMLNVDGKYMVSKRTRNERITPIIDLTGKVASDNFKVGTLLNAVIENGKITITVRHSTELKEGEEL